MSNSIIIELGDEAIGLVQRLADSAVYVFLASDWRFQALEGQRFASPFAVEAAARDHRRGRSTAAYKPFVKADASRATTLATVSP